MEGARGVRCCVCCEPLPSPRSLFCLNVYCPSCLSDVIAMSEGTFDCSALDPTTSLSALTQDGATCRSSSQERQHQSSNTEEEHSFALARVPGVNNEIVIECGNCRQENRVAYASTWCRECHMGYCKQCLEHHQKVKVTACHRLVPASQADLQEELQRSQDLMCPNHGKPLAFFCRDHSCLACPRCVFEKHRSCPRVQEACSASQEIKRDVTKRLPHLERALGDLRRCRREMLYEEARVSQELSQVRQLIGERAESWVERIRQHQAELERRAQEQSRQSEEALSQTRRQLELQTCAVAEAVELMRRLQTTSDPVDVVRGAALVAGPLGFPSVDPPRVPRIEPLTLSHHPDVERVLSSTLSLGRMAGGVQGRGRGGWVTGRGLPPTPTPQPKPLKKDQRPEPEIMWVGPLPGYDRRSEGKVPDEATKAEPPPTARSRERSMGHILMQPGAEKLCESPVDSPRVTSVAPRAKVKLPQTSPRERLLNKVKSWCDNFDASHRSASVKVLESPNTTDSDSSRVIDQRIVSRLDRSLTRKPPQTPRQLDGPFLGEKVPQVFRKTYMRSTVSSAAKGGSLAPSAITERFKEPVEFLRQPSAARQLLGACLEVPTPSTRLSSSDRLSTLLTPRDLDSARRAFWSIPSSVSSNGSVFTRREPSLEVLVRQTSRQKNELKSAVAHEKNPVAQAFSDMNRSPIPKFYHVQSVERNTSKLVDADTDNSRISSLQSESEATKSNVHALEDENEIQKSPLASWLRSRRGSQDAAPPRRGSPRKVFVGNPGTELSRPQAPGTLAVVPVKLETSDFSRPLTSRPCNSPRPEHLFRNEEYQGGSTSRSRNEEVDKATRIHPTVPSTSIALRDPHISPDTSRPSFNVVRKEQNGVFPPLKVRGALWKQSSSSSYESSSLDPPPTSSYNPSTSVTSESLHDVTSGGSSGNSGSERRDNNAEQAILFHRPRPVPRNSQSLPIPGNPPPKAETSPKRKRRTPSRSPEQPVAVKFTQSQVATRDLIGVNRSGNQGHSYSQLTSQIDSSPLKDASNTELFIDESTASSSGAKARPTEANQIPRKTPEKTTSSKINKKDLGWNFLTRPITRARCIAKKETSGNVPQREKASEVVNSSEKQDSGRAMVDASTSAVTLTVTTSSSPELGKSSGSTKPQQASPDSQQEAPHQEFPSLPSKFPVVPCKCQAVHPSRIKDIVRESSLGPGHVQIPEACFHKRKPSPYQCVHSGAPNRRARTHSSACRHYLHCRTPLFGMECMQTDGATIEISTEGATAAEGEPISGSSDEYSVQTSTKVLTLLPPAASTPALQGEGVKIPIAFGPVCRTSSCRSRSPDGGQKEHSRFKKLEAWKEETAKNSGYPENKRRVLIK